MSVDVKIHVYDDKVLSIHDLEVFFSNWLGSKYFNLNIETTREEENQIWQRVGNTESICIEEVMDSFSPKTEEIITLIGENLPVINDALVQQLSELDKSVGTWASNFYGKKLFWVSW